MIEHDTCGDSKTNVMVSSSVLTWHANDPFPGRMAEQFCISQRTFESVIEDRYGIPFLAAVLQYLIEIAAIIDVMEDGVTEGIHLSLSAQQKRALQKLGG